MIPVRKSGMRGLVLAGALTSSLAFAPAAVADGGAAFNDATVTIRGGDGVAIATCINWAQDWAKLSPKDQKRHERRRVVQANRCKNTADALGGTVELTGVSVFIDQAGKRRAARNSATVTIEGGDALAVAACVNVLNATASARQVNDCKNSAIATGGDVLLDHVDIEVVQTTG